MSRTKMFVVTIQITKKSWDYETGDKIHIPIQSISRYHALTKLERYDGSEYPSYIVIDVYECDKFLFKPIL